MSTDVRVAIVMVVVIGVLASGCASSSSSPVLVTYTLGHFPAVPTGSFSRSTAGTLQAALDAAVKKGLPGIAATVLAADGKSWSGAAGTADGVHPLEVSSQFAIASITKTVIAAEVMRLSEKGLLRLSDPVSKHLPSGFKFDTNGATVENLLHMESGIPDPAPNDAALAAFYGRPPDPLHAWTPQEVLASVPTDRSKPGDHYVYEDANYMLLGLVIQHVTGTNVAAALRSDVLSDPRVSSMVYQPQEQPKGPLGLPFGTQVGANNGGYLPNRAEASEGNGSGCMASDSAALATWGYLLFGGQIVSAQSLLAMTDFGSGFYGLGVFNQTKTGAWRGPGQAIGNGGWDPAGYSSALAVLPGKGIVISVMTNTAGDPKVLVFPVAEALASSLQKRG